ncbi:MAG: bifunctional tRNA (5-methylaminomethyl-2-thiouridine)(34)-methyltransferase MnmD/FAD-dependent 5-carboxymethylaminomethyl-2-thiouridine(34) oxidoreductase MnmC [Gammaproteobacteria bacterium]|nr:bifunctional tRNA (5-methylaminomethyl-2-thiouridine)(34)-methyltransferase MnmD/FAD-dependent 5-carboxymethylaminomethyl-2-thiouridine(34) oxidoreductase MnmC [Gammaproteobacteria bacterium]
MKYAQIEWNNGTPHSAEYDDVYFSDNSGIDESQHVFLHQNQLPQRWQQKTRFVIAETGFGIGLNFIVTMMTWLRTVTPPACLHFISIEKHPVSPRDVARMAARLPELEPYYDDLLKVYPPPLPGRHLLEFAGGRVKLYLIFDEVEHALEQFEYKVDAWYLDGFAPSRNSAMWNDRVFELIARNTTVGGSFATYTAAGAVRRGLTQAGFVVKKSEGFGRKRAMLSGFIFEQRCYIVDQPWYRLPECSCREQQAVIIGAGLAGLTTAWALVRRGWDIILLDSHADIAAGASGNPAGLLMPRLASNESLDSRFYLNAYVYAIHCLDHLQSATEDQFWFKTGNLSVAHADRLRRMCASHQFTEDFIRYVDSDTTKHIAGVDLNAGALLLVDAGWVNVRLLCESLRLACADALTYRQTTVVDIRFNHGVWHVIDETDETVLTTACLVMANAAQVSQCPALNWLPIESARGQLTLAPRTEASRCLRCAISGKRYITPAYAGQHVVGASYRRDDDATSLSVSEQQANIDAINQMVPALLDEHSELAGRVAFRAVSKDRVPIVGCVPDRAAFEQDYRDLHHGKPARSYPNGRYLPDLYLSTAHGSRGLSSCFMSAELIAALVCGEPTPVEKAVVDYLNPARFIIRQLKRTPGARL